MSINANQLRTLITEFLETIELYSKDALELLMLTAAQETYCGTYIKQLGGGPALGIFQMEPNTHEDIWENYLCYNPSIFNKILKLSMQKEFSINNAKYFDMIGNIPYQIGMARIYYLRKKEELPDAGDVLAMAEYYKKYWNTYKGKATVQEAIDNYIKYAF